MPKEAWLLQELHGLVEKGVIDAATAERLRAHYAPAAGAAGAWPRIGWGMLLLSIGGAALIAGGIVLLFAHNWENWTPGMRVGLSLLPLLAGQLAGLYALRNGSRTWSEGAGIFTAIAIGASIALIAQTYQFGGDLPRFLMVWLLLAAPLVYVLDSSAVASFCWALATGWIIASPHDGWWAQSGDVQQALRLPVFLALFSLPLPHLVRHLRIDRASPRVNWMLRAAIIAALFGLGFGASHHDREAVPLMYAALAAAMALAGQHWFGGAHGIWGNPLRSVGQLGIFIAALSMTVEFARVHLHWPSSSIMLLPLLLGVAALYFGWRLFAAGDRVLAPLFAALPVLFYVMPSIGRASTVVSGLLSHAYVLAIAGALIQRGFALSRLRLANAGVALLTALVLLRFFDSQLSYIVRGVGFIVTGVAFFVAIFWLRRRVRGAAAT